MPKTVAGKEETLTVLRQNHSISDEEKTPEI